MGYKFIAVTKIESSTGNNSSGTVTSSAGNALFGCATTRTGATAIPSISGGGTWTSDTSLLSGGASAGISSNPNATGGSQTITATITGTNHGVTAFYYEFSGNVQGGIKDANSPAVKTGSGTAATSNTLTNATQSAVFIVCMGDTSTSATATVTGTGSGFIYPAGGKETNGSSFTATSTGYRIVNLVTTASDAVTIDSSAWLDMIAVYKAVDNLEWFSTRTVFDEIEEEIFQSF